MSAYPTHPEIGFQRTRGQVSSAALPMQARPPRAIVGPPPLARIHSDAPRMEATLPQTQQAAADRPSSPAPLVRTDAAPRAETPARMPAARPALSIVDKEMHNLARMVDGSAVTEAALRRARAILEDAYESATEVRLDALSRVREQATATDKEAEEILERARTEAGRIKTQAALEAQLALQRTQRHADQVVARAQGEAERLVREARAGVQKLREESVEQARRASAAAARTVLTGNARPNNKRHPLEAEFDATAREFVMWLGLPAQPAPARAGRSIFRRGKASEATGKA